MTKASDSAWFTPSLPFPTDDGSCFEGNAPVVGCVENFQGGRFVFSPFVGRLLLFFFFFVGIPGGKKRKSRDSKFHVFWIGIGWWHFLGG